MEKSKKVLLPGLNRQLEFLFDEVEISGLNALIIGAESGILASELSGKTNSGVEIIVEDYHSLINTKLAVEPEKDIEVKLMDYSATDYPKETFDLIYAQASTGTYDRNAIAKEIKRIMHPGGLFCCGELTLIKKNPPPFVMNMFDASGMEPLIQDDLADYWQRRGWEVRSLTDLSGTLKEFYTGTVEKLSAGLGNLSDQEKSYYKSLINQINHDSNVYNKLGGNKFIGFDVALLRKL